MFYLCTQFRTQCKDTTKNQNDKIMIATDERINRNMCWYKYVELCKEKVKELLNLDRDITGCEMTWDEFKAVSYKQNYLDVQVDCILDFNAHTITINVK